MIDTVEELSKEKKVYVLYDSLGIDDILYAVYTIGKTEYRGINKYFVQMKTSSRHKWFPKTLNIAGFHMEFRTNRAFKVFNDLNEMYRYYCRQAKKNPEKNPKLIKKLTAQFPQYFI